MKIYKIKPYRDFGHTRYSIYRLIFGFIWWPVECDFLTRELAVDYIQDKNKTQLITVE